MPEILKSQSIRIIVSETGLTSQSIRFIASSAKLNSSSHHNSNLNYKTNNTLDMLKQAVGLIELVIFVRK